MLDCIDRQQRNKLKLDNLSLPSPGKSTFKRIQRLKLQYFFFFSMLYTERHRPLRHQFSSGKKQRAFIRSALSHFKPSLQITCTCRPSTYPIWESISVRRPAQKIWHGKTQQVPLVRIFFQFIHNHKLLPTLLPCPPPFLLTTIEQFSI